MNLLDPQVEEYFFRSVWKSTSEWCRIEDFENKKLGYLHMPPKHVSNNAPQIGLFDLDKLILTVKLHSSNFGKTFHEIKDSDGTTLGKVTHNFRGKYFLTRDNILLEWDSKSNLIYDKSSGKKIAERKDHTVHPKQFWKHPTERVNSLKLHDGSIDRKILLGFFLASKFDNFYSSYGLEPVQYVGS